MVTVQEFARVWLHDRERDGHHTQTTVVCDRMLLSRHVLPVVGDRELADVTPSEIGALLASLSTASNPRTGKPKVHTARRVAVVFRKMLRDAAEQGLCPNNPARVLKLPSAPQESPRMMTLDEVVRVLEAVRDDYKPFVLVAMLTGARFGELRELRWKDIDLDEGLLHIRRQHPTHEPQNIRAPKWGSVRTVEMLAPVREVLGALGPGNPDSLVFPARDGGPVNPSHFRRYIWNPALRQSGVRLKPHEMRDIFISLLIAFGEDIMRVTRQTGHRHLAVFFQHYAHEFRRKEGRLSREETYQRFMTALRSPADPERHLYVGVNQAAKMLGASWGWLFELVRRGEIPAVRRGQWLIRREDLTCLRPPRRRRVGPQPGEGRKR